MWFPLENTVNMIFFVNYFINKKKKQSKFTQKTIPNIFHVTILVDLKKQITCL